MTQSKILNTDLFLKGPVKRNDKIIFSIYFVLTAFTFFYLLHGQSENVERWVLMYGFSTHLVFYLFLYVSLRNLTTFLIWMGFSLFHLFLYLNFYQEGATIATQFSMMPLRNTAILLLVFQLLRWSFQKIKKVNLVMPYRSGTDLFGERIPGILDFVWLIFYMIAFFVLNIIPFFR